MNGGGGSPTEPREIRLKSFDDYELTLGDLMRGERATKGKSLLDVQRDIKIRAEYLAGIEDADLAAFETPGFIAGYVKSYARYLGMNPDWVYTRFCEESGFSHVAGLDAQVHTRKPRPGVRQTGKGHAGDAILARSPISSAPRQSPFAGLNPSAIGSVVVLAAVVAGLGYGGWSVLQEIQRVTLAPVDTPLGGAPAVTTDALPERDGLNIDNAAPTMAALERLYRPEVLEAPVLIPRDGPIAMLDPGAQGVFASYEGPRPADAPAPTEPLAPLIAEAGTGAADPQVVAPPPPEVVLFARRPAWVRVRAADGTVLLEKILEQGERFVLPETETPPTLRAGNSGSVFFAVNGETFGPAGPGTSVAKNVVLSADALRADYALADLSEDPELARLAELVIVADLPAEADGEAPAE